MKTKIRTFIGLVALGVIGFTNNNATAANNLNSNLWIENSEIKTTKVEKAELEKTLEMVEGMSEEDFFKAAETYTASGSDMEIEKYATRQIENSVAKAGKEEADYNFLNEAESFTASGSDKEIEKYANKLIALENERR